MSLSKALGIVSGINEIGNFIQLFGSAISYLRSRQNNGGLEQQIQELQVQEQQIQEHQVQQQQIQEHEVLQLQSDLRDLSDTLPSMYNIIDRAEWKSHEKCVEQLIPKLKDTVYDAEDLMDEFRWYEIKLSVEGNSSTRQSSIVEFFHNVIRSSFNRVADIQKRLTNLSNHLEKMGLHEATPRFDKSVRPVTTSFRTEAKIFGRENEIDEVVTLLGVPKNSSGSSSKRKRTCNAAINEPWTACVPILPIVGMGGVGKTTLAQEITTLQRVKSHFNRIIWICVSDEFDAERLTKILIKSLSGKEARIDNFDDLQQHLAREVQKKRFLLVLDDIWPDAVKEDGRNWRKFCAPLKNVHQESRLLVTTRFVEVADTVGTMKHFALEGLKPEVFWDFFKSCVFGSENCHIDTQLEQIGRNIVPKLKGSPLAAITIGRLLRRSLTNKHWNDIQNSELWQLQQKETDILPALRLSYMYLPFHLKRCFSFCAVYPKDYNFKKSSLAEIWVAEGFVVPQGDIPLQRIGEQYFEDLVNLSFFQKLLGKYVIHDLMHDMAQLVSKDECFIIKKLSDFQKVPQNVRHLSILASCHYKIDYESSLCKHGKLRTLISKKACYNPLWVNQLPCLRVVSLSFTMGFLENISNLKHLRYLEIRGSCYCMGLPPSFLHLYNLQIFYARKCLFESLSIEFNFLINLQKFEARVVKHTLDIDALDWGKTCWLLSNNTIQQLVIINIGSISKDHAVKIGNILKMKYLDSLTLEWSSLRSQEHIGIEALQALNPSRSLTSLKSLHLKGYPGEYLPWGSNLCTLPTSMPPLSGGSDTPEENINQNKAPMVIVSSNDGQIRSIFPSLTELRIEGSEQLSSLEQFLQPECVPAISVLVVENCPRLSLSLESAKVADLRDLKNLTVRDCPNIFSGRMLAPYLEFLVLSESRDLGGSLMPILDLQIWSLPALQYLKIIGLNSITFTKRSLSHHSSSNNSTKTLSLLFHLTIMECDDLKNFDVLLSHEYLPAIREISFHDCAKLQYLPGERFGSFSSLRDLRIWDCPYLNWQSGMLLPSCLLLLSLKCCGDISSWFIGCLENLSSLQQLDIMECERIMSIPSHLWRRNLTSLTRLQIIECPDLVSIGGPNAIAHLTWVRIESCEKLEEIHQPYSRG